MQARHRLWRSLVLVLVLVCGIVGCGGKKEPEDMIRISVVSTGEPAQRDVLLVPDLDGATVEIWEYKEPPDLSWRKKKDAKPVPPTRSSRISKADWVALWKAFPKGHIWNLADAKPATNVGSLPIYTVELKNNGRHVKATIEGPDQCADKSGWQIIEPVMKAAGIK